MRKSRSNAGLLGSCLLVGAAVLHMDQLAIAQTVQTQGPRADQGPVVSGPGAGPSSHQAGNAAGLPPPPGARAGIGDRPIDADEARVTASELAHELERYYVFPETGRRYAAAVRANAARGAYDSYRSSAALAARLQADLLAIAPDNHLRVTVGAPDAPRPSQATTSFGAFPPGVRPRFRVRALEGSLEPPRWLPHGIAYLKINSFAGDDQQLASIRQFMSDYAGAQTIIFDLRTNEGGGFAEMDIMFPYLFSEPTTLAVLETRSEADPIALTRMQEGPTLRRVADRGGYVRRVHIVEPHASEKQLQRAQVFVLTSSQTRSSGEHFAMALKSTGRGVVIGETTAGAGHTTMGRPLGGGFAASVPVGRTVDPKTGEGWEGTGIVPDMQVPAERALIEALVRSGVTRDTAQQISAALATATPAT